MPNTHKITVSLPNDIREQIETLKKEKYKDLSYSELYRQAIGAGIEALQIQKSAKK